MHDPLLRTGRKRREQRETERKTEKDGEIEKNRERAQKKRNTEEPREKCRPWKRGTEERRGRRDADLFCFATFSPEPREPIKMPSSSTAPVCYLFRVPFLFPLRPFRFRENFSPSAPPHPLSPLDARGLQRAEQKGPGRGGCFTYLQHVTGNPRLVLIKYGSRVITGELKRPEETRR